MCPNPGVTVQVLSSMARTKAVDSMVQDRTVSVRPSRNMRVIEDSYVRQNSPLSYSESNSEKPLSTPSPTANTPEKTPVRACVCVVPCSEQAVVLVE